MNRATVAFGTKSEAITTSKAHIGMSEEKPKNAITAANDPMLCLMIEWSNLEINNFTMFVVLPKFVRKKRVESPIEGS
ncbi:hypothetical protein GCM10025858_24750 [Alicyclobacillus sacchari]|nr:hypothetical protein GCM10025858_24750 [Alicyclobacillus sacchari]